MTDNFDTVLIKAAGIFEDHPLADTISGRSNIIELSEQSHTAALIPDPPGGLSHSERAALACRISRLNNENILARHYEIMLQGSDKADSASLIADTGFDGGDDTRLNAILRHTDLVSVNPKDTTEGDISALRSAAIPDEDIVRLSELIAFVSYQIRVVAGLRLMEVVI